jgi:flagellar hook-length control protein FliK
MQNAMDIMTMVQKTGIVKPKFDVPSKTLGSYKESFRKELNLARQEAIKDSGFNKKASDVNPQRTIEKKVEKFAKVMSNHGIKADVQENPSVEESEQTDTPATESNLAVSDAQLAEQLEESTMPEEPVQTILEMLQQLIQMMQGQKTEGTSNQQAAKMETELQAIVQKLEQALEMPMTSQSGELKQLLNSLKNDFSELIKQLELISEYNLDDKQTEQFINQLTDKLNQAQAQAQAQVKAQMHQVLQQPEKTEVHKEGSNLQAPQAVKVENKEAVSYNTERSTEAEVENQQTQGLNADKAADSKDESDSQKEEESTYKTNASSETKQAAAGDKLNQADMSEVVSPQEEKLNFQLNIKQANVNLQKESLVKLNKSDILNQVIKKADVIVQGSHQEMIMKLEPESLGKLNLKLVVENGLVTAKFVAESQQVKEVLESSFNQLKDALQEKGIAVQSFSVSVGQQGAEFGSGQGYEQWKKSIKLTNKVSGDYMQLDDEESSNTNPYSYHEGKVDFRA